MNNILINKTISKKEILKQRAQLIAEKPDIVEESGEFIEGLEIALGKEHYFIPSTFVNEVSKINSITSLPLTPDFFVGIINLRGKILAVIDIKAFMNIPSPGITDLNKVIIVEDNGIEFCILADSIIGSRKVDINSLQENAKEKRNLNSDFILGITKDMLIVLNIERLINDETLKINQ